MSLAVWIASGFERDRGCHFLTPDALSRAACSLPWAPKPGAPKFLAPKHWARKLWALFLLPDVASRLLALHGVLHGALPGEQRGALPIASGWLNGSGPSPAGR
jgi:hypothetical protein